MEYVCRCIRVSKRIPIIPYMPAFVFFPSSAFRQFRYSVRPARISASFCGWVITILWLVQTTSTLVAGRWTNKLVMY